MPTQKAPLQKTSNKFRKPFINRIHRPSRSPQKTHSLGRPENNIDWQLSSIATALASGIIYIDISKFRIPLNISILISLTLTPIALCIIFPNLFFLIRQALKKLLDKIDTIMQAIINFSLPPLLVYLSAKTFFGAPEIPRDYHFFIILSTLIPLLPTIVYTFHKFDRLENWSINKAPLNGEKIKPQTPFEKLKSTTQLVPIIISISFAFILIQNIVLMYFDLGLAIHLTATEFTNAKYEWISFMFILIIVTYSTFLPSLALSSLYGGVELIQKIPPFKSLKSYFIYLAEQRSITPKSTSSVDARKAIGILLTLPRHVITITLIMIIEATFRIILGLQNSPPTFIYILAFSVIAYLSASIYILSRNSANPAKVKKILYSSCLKILLFITIIFSILFQKPAIVSSIENSSSLGKAISSPSVITNSSENTQFSCAFLNKPNSTESIAFGVIVSSKDSSIHVFSPSRDEVTGQYAHSAEGGKLYPNKLVETHVKVSEGYHIEKFNKSKHWFNPKRGSCNYRNEPPFYEYQQVKSKLIIRNIS